ncbi:hypothetical protein UFOVP1019_49 [uncultured Caudovirales phage]|jgi:hypothetical protein|uniref:Uncharacterized protein n=1 Tax=uncultured Caudovirales phage TaxID=2100421 RepID=A0A6J5Q185_9CAUD|nr:hypothetical protein UFOVP846_37 [uncultured Caudovirales phage]CAB4173344.1 hypothetical protein UFOVP940_51 [uncultured Caudovirales phage]CAB4178648.1 hypothetical protein UFOVP1019_49 [uncultured Caudovirales phage]CAB4219476.1 hypothetical protein UFOVP1618_23 [uncultured Caudovirales phage]
MAIANDKEFCSFCRFFSGQEPMGACRRFPELRNKSPNDWCGEFMHSKNLVIESITSGLTVSVSKSMKNPIGRPKKS